MDSTPDERIPVWMSVGDLPATQVGVVEDPTDARQLVDLLRAVADEFERIA